MNRDAFWSFLNNNDDDDESGFFDDSEAYPIESCSFGLEAVVDEDVSHIILVRERPPQEIIDGIINQLQSELGKDIEIKEMTQQEIDTFIEELEECLEESDEEDDEGDPEMWNPETWD